MAAALSPGGTRVFTCQCVAAQLGSPQDAPSWSGLPKQLGHARPRAHMLAEARFPRRYPGRASPVRGFIVGPSKSIGPLPGHPLSAIEGARAHEVGDGTVEQCMEVARVVVVFIVVLDSRAPTRVDMGGEGLEELERGAMAGRLGS